MTQRLIAACVAVPAVLALLAYVFVAKLPYATYSPGGTIDVLGQNGQQNAIVQVDGAETFPSRSELRMTTVRVSQPAADPAEQGLPLTTLVSRWLADDSAVYPYDAVHGENETPQSNERRGAEQMANSQDYAVEVALSELGYEVPEVLKVASVTPDSPSQGKLRVDDVLLAVDGTRVRDDDQLRRLIQQGEQGRPLTLRIRRDGGVQTVQVTPAQQDGRRLIGIIPGYDFEFPIDVDIDIDPRIGGPSAGLVFSLAVYDTLTPGSLTGGADVAGTGEIYPDGSVGPIGGIAQKIAGAREDGADLFLVPEANCAAALAADSEGDMRLMLASTMHDVRLALQDYAENPDAELPSCEDAA